MNITLKPSEGTRGFSSFLNATTQGLPADTHNATVAILSSLNATNVFLWDLKWFGVFAGPLVLTVPLSVAVGKLLRVTAKSWYHYKIYWRWTVVAITLLMFPSIYWVLPYYSKSTDGSGGVSAGYVAYIVLNVVFLGLFALYRVWHALYEGEDQVIWFIFLLVVGACFGIDFSGLPPGQLALDPVMAVPWLYLVGLWTWNYFGTRRHKKKKKKHRDNSVFSGSGEWPRTASEA